MARAVQRGTRAYDVLAHRREGQRRSLVLHARRLID